MRGDEMIFMERVRQITQEGFTPEHDTEHGGGELIDAACCYALRALACATSDTEVSFVALRRGEVPDGWPWNRIWWKPSDDPIRNLVKAGALIAAEIDRQQGRG